MERKRAAAARLAVDADEAAMAAHHVIDDGKPEAGALRPRAGVGLNPEELSEDLTLKPRRNADAVIADADDAVPVDAIDLDFNRAVLGRVLHRVRDQVLERLHGGFRVDQHRHLAVQLRGDRELIVRELALERLEDAARQLDEVDLLAMGVGSQPVLDFLEV